MAGFDPEASTEIPVVLYIGTSLQNGSDVIVGAPSRGRRIGVGAAHYFQVGR